MSKNEKVFNAVQGVVIYHYDFTNKEGIKVNTTKALLNIFNMPIFVTSSSLNNKNIGSKILCEVYYDGKDWKLYSDSVKDA